MKREASVGAGRGGRGCCVALRCDVFVGGVACCLFIDPFLDPSASSRHRRDEITILALRDGDAGLMSQNHGLCISSNPRLL